MKKIVTLNIFFIFIVCAAIFITSGCVIPSNNTGAEVILQEPAEQSDDAVEAVQNENSDSFAITSSHPEIPLSQIYAVHSFGDATTGFFYRIFEAGGGDPVMNGDIFMLVIDDPNTGESREYDLDINAKELIKAEIDNNKMILYVREDKQNEEAGGEIISTDAAYTFELDPSNWTITKK